MVPAPRPAPAPGRDPARASARLCHVAFAGVLLLFCAHVYVRGATLDPTGRDQAADMTLGLQIGKGGDMTDGNRHPLLPAILSLWASRGPGYVVDARLVAILIAALALLALYAAAARLFSPRLALLAAAIYALELRLQARLVCPEPLLALLLVGATTFLARLPSARRAWPFALAAGACLGLAWLAKGTATLSLVAATAWVLWTRRRRGIGPAALLWLGFAVAASPLLVFNVERHGSPFFNANTAHVMWEDKWDADLDRTSDATVGSYWRGHSAGQIVGRLAHGLAFQKGVEWIYGFLALALLARWARRRSLAGGPAGPWACRPDSLPGSPQRAWRGLAIATCLVWLPPLAWYEPIVASRRMLFPVFATLIPPALDLLAGLAPGRVAASAAASGLARFGRAAAWPFALLAVAASAFLAIRHGNPLEEKHVDDATIALVQRLSQETYAGAVVLAKPSRTIPPDWLLYRKVTLAAIPFAVGDADAPSWIAKRAQYLLVSSGLLAQRPGIAGALASWDPEKGLVPKPLPPWLVEEYRDPSLPSKYWLLRVVPAGGR